MLENEKIVESIRSTMAFENLILTLQDELLIKQFLDKEITEIQGIQKIKDDFLSRMV
ncbi:MAG: hypothetical protein RSB76_01280 [Clostridia bacterium]